MGTTVSRIKAPSDLHRDAEAVADRKPIVSVYHLIILTGDPRGHQDTKLTFNATDPMTTLTPPSEFLAACPKFRLLVLGSPESTKLELFTKIFGVDLEKVS